jgi:triacylglycerol lipase
VNSSIAVTIPQLKAPIVLVHGLFGFDRVQVGGLTVACYFPGIPEALELAGNRVLIPALPPTGAVADRALGLKKFILRTSPAEPVHIIAHSMGGLDSRYMISCLGMEHHVLSLTTLGTPHRGSAFADWGVRRLERLVKPVLEFIGMPAQGFYDLTRESCQAFNERVPDVPTVRYYSMAARHDGNFYRPEWLLPYHIVLTTEGPNDGVVSVASAEHGEVLEVCEGDHLSLVNWFNPFDPCRGADRAPLPRYAKILQRLADAGY